MDAGTLYSEIVKVCPVETTKVEVADNRATWSFVPGTGATQPQIDAGNNVIATIPVDQEPPFSPAKTALYDHENRILALEGSPPLTREQFSAKVKMV